MFPSDNNERTQYPIWAFKARALLMSKGLEDYIERPLFGLPELQGGMFEEDEDVKYIRASASINAPSSTKYAQRKCTACLFNH
jgi:hypothetical protein